MNRDCYLSSSTVVGHLPGWQEQAFSEQPGEAHGGFSLARIVSYVLVQLAPGNAGSIARKISRIPGVKMAHAVTGPFDIIAYVEVPDLEALSDLVLSRLQKVKGVEKTQTALVVSPTSSPGMIKGARRTKKA
jgi:DNA-binding Lrp family transcriptional regulator